MANDSDTTDEPTSPSKAKVGRFAGIGVAIGLPLGWVLGDILGDPTYWGGAGIATGAATGVAVAYHGWLGRSNEKGSTGRTVDHS